MTQTSFNKSRILNAIAKVEDFFPFEGYITEADRPGIIHVIRQIANYKTQGTLLDIGCGPMNDTAVFQKLGFECYAVDDLSDPWHRLKNNLELILEFADKVGISFHLQSDGDYSIPFPQDAFDIVIISGVIEHLHESPRDILNNAALHLKDGGLLCINMPNSVNLRKRMSVLFGRTNHVPIDQFFSSVGRWRGHVREYTLAETVYMCRAMRFEVLSATTYEGGAYEKLKTPFLQLYLLLSHIIPTVRSSLCVLARKPADWVPIEPNPDIFCQLLNKLRPDNVYQSQGK